MNKKGIIFDLDGTLIDTLEDLKLSVNHVIEARGYMARSLDEIRSFVGNGIRKLLERSIGIEIDSLELDQIYSDMTEYYGLHSMDNTAPYNGVVEAVERLKSAGYKLAVVTNKVQPAAEQIVKMFFGDIFDVIVGDTPELALKPAPDGVYKALDVMRLNRDEVYYIGDSEVDVQTANNAGVDMLAVLWGFRTREFLEANGCQNFVESTSELCDKILGK